MQNLVSVPVDIAYRLFNLGATALVGAAAEGRCDIMPATWNCPLDYGPSKVTLVLDKCHYTRELVEKSGYFALMLPGKAVAKQVMQLGTVSKHDDAEKIEKVVAGGAELFNLPGTDIPMMRGCAAYAVFKVIPQKENEEKFDLFIGECVAAWADKRVCNEKAHWNFAGCDDLRTLHYVAGGHFFVIGDELNLPEYD